MAELVDALGLGSSDFGRGGSSPFTCIIFCLIVMKKLLFALMLIASPALADHKEGHIKGYNSMDSMGCMLLRECTDGVKEVFSLLDVSSEYPNTDEFTFVINEFNNMLTSLNSVGVKVFLADSKYFPPMHRGVYHTVGNNFCLLYTSPSPRDRG